MPEFVADATARASMKISSPLNRQLTLGVLVIADPNRKEPMPSAPEFLRIAMSVVASVFSLTAALAAEQSVRPPQLQMETFGPLPGGRVGVVQDGLLHCLEPSQKEWRRCRDWQALELPADTQRVLGNERVLSVVREKQIDFYHTHANPSLDKSLPLESGWSAQRMTTGEYSTEPEMVLRNPDQLIVRLPGDPDSNLTQQLDCPDAEGRRVFGLMGPARWALIDSTGILAIAIQRSAKGLTCVRDPERDWVAPPGTDEAAIIGLDLLAVRTATRIRFLKYDPKTKAWEPARAWRSTRNAVPDLLLDGWMDGPASPLKSVRTNTVPTEGVLQALIERVVPTPYASARVISTRFVLVIKYIETQTEQEAQRRFGVLDAQGTELLPTIYTHIEHDSKHGRFKVAMGSGDNTRWSYLDEAGQPVSDMAFELVRRLSNGGGEPTALVVIQGKIGYFDFVQGKMLVDPSYDALIAESTLIDGHGEGVLLARRGNTWGLLNTNGQALTELVYNRLRLGNGELIGAVGDKQFRLNVVETQLIDVQPVDLSDESASISQRSFGGIGASLVSSVGGSTLAVDRLLEGSPAKEAGMKIGDRIIKVNGRSVAKMAGPQAISIIRGTVGSIVALAVQRGERRFTLRIKRELIKMD